MLEQRSLWDTATRVHQLLSAQLIPHALVGGVAVCLHGYRRTTIDINSLVRSGDSQAVRSSLQSAGFEWEPVTKEFRGELEIPVQFLVAGERAGSGSEVQLPDPLEAENVVTIEGLPVITLARLIEAKIACGEGNLRRTHKDFADVVELIAHHQLGGEFARYLHKSVRRTFRQLTKNAQGSE